MVTMVLKITVLVYKVTAPDYHQYTHGPPPLFLGHLCSSLLNIDNVITWFTEFMLLTVYGDSNNHTEGHYSLWPSGGLDDPCHNIHSPFSLSQLHIAFVLTHYYHHFLVLSVN